MTHNGWGRVKWSDYICIYICVCVCAVNIVFKLKVLVVVTTQPERAFLLPGGESTARGWVTVHWTNTRPENKRVESFRLGLQYITSPWRHHDVTKPSTVTAVTRLDSRGRHSWSGHQLTGIRPVTSPQIRSDQIIVITKSFRNVMIEKLLVYGVHVYVGSGVRPEVKGQETLLCFDLHVFIICHDITLGCLLAQSDNFRKYDEDQTVVVM